jgi:hypothetical protein
MTKKTPHELFMILSKANMRVMAGLQYIHNKSGDVYTVLSITLREEDLEPLVIYVPVDVGLLAYSISFARPIDEFDEKFTILTVADNERLNKSVE